MPAWIVDGEEAVPEQGHPQEPVDPQNEAFERRVFDRREVVELTAVDLEPAHPPETNARFCDFPRCAGEPPRLAFIRKLELADHAWRQEGRCVRAGIEKDPKRPLVIDAHLEDGETPPNQLERQ